MVNLGYGIVISEEQYNYEFCNFWTDDRKYFDNEEEAKELYEKVKADNNYEDVVIYKGKTVYFSTGEDCRIWKADSWVVGWKKVPLMRRLRHALSA